MSDPPKIPPPIHVELNDIYTTSDQAPAFVLKLEDGTWLTVQLPTDSLEADEFLQFVTELVNRRLQMFGSLGIEITGFTPPDEDDE